MEKQANARNAKIQSAEAKLKQREMQLSQQQQDLQKKKSETDAIRANLDTQLEMVEKKKQELEKLHKSEVERLEHLSGISAEEAKERLVESLKEEAKTQAASYINDIMDDAKMTANKEAKRIVIQSIQRVATETAIENSVTVFHIESDEIKGRIIGRKVVISELSKRLPGWKLSWTIPPKPLCFRLLIPFAVKSPVWPCISW